MSDIAKKLQLTYALADRESSQSFRKYLNRVVIDSRPQPKRFGDIAEQWQWDRAEAITAAVEQAAGLRSDYNGPLNFYFGYSKGHDKSSFVARLCNWFLAYSKYRAKAFACAADAEQASIIRQCMEAEAALNPWLLKRLTILNRVAYSSYTGASLEILASDAASGQGKLPDLLIMDEVTHWQNKDFFDAMYSARNKRPTCVTIICCNAGHFDTWQYELRNIAKESKSWHFFEQPVGVQLASWMSSERIAEDRKLLTPTEARRLLDNEWIDPGEEAGFVTLQDALACEEDKLEHSFSCGSRPHRLPHHYIAAIDYGVRNDRTALCVGHFDKVEEKVIIDRLDTYQGSADKPVTIKLVEKWIEEVKADYQYISFVIDPYQMLSTIQKYQHRSYDIREFEYLAGKRNYELAQNLRNLIVNKQIKWPKDAGKIVHVPQINKDDTLKLYELPAAYVEGTDTLASELSQIIIKLMNYGYKIDHQSGRHDDRSVAVGMMSLVAVENQRTPLTKPQSISNKKDPLHVPPQRTWMNDKKIWGIQ